MLQLAPWRVLGIDECGEASPQKTARYARTFLGAPFSRRRSQAHATQRKDRKTKSTGSRKRFAMQRFFGKRRRNGAKRAVCSGKPPKSEVYGDEKARRRGAVPANPLGDRLPLFRCAWLSFIGFYRSAPLEFCLFRQA